MPANNSSTGGLIGPTSTAPNYDDPFDAFLQILVTGIVGLSGNLVRPRWQATVPKEPETSVDWAAIGVMTAEPMSSRSQIIHDPNGTIVAPVDGSDVETSWERVTVLASMYGPHAWSNIGFLDGGLRISQNRESMTLAGVGLLDIGTRTMLAELVNMQFVRRVDMPIRFTRVISRVYPIYSLISAQGDIRHMHGNVQEIDNFRTRIS